MKTRAKSSAVADFLMASIHTLRVSRSVKHTMALLPFFDRGNSDRISYETTLNRVVGIGNGVGMPRVLALYDMFL